MRIELYGKLAEAVGHEIDLPIPAGATIAEARQLLIAAYPHAAPALAAPVARALVNDRSADEGQVVPDDAVLAFLPPLSGG